MSGTFHLAAWCPAVSGRAILLAGAAALLPVLGSSSLADAAAQVQARFAPPSTPLVLTRTLYRDLSDGKQVVVTRRYAIRISPDGDGFRVDGTLIDATVDAPPFLARLAELERQRPDTGVFPALLDGAGMIRSGNAAPLDPQTRRRAMASARAVIADAPAPVEARRETGSLLNQVANGGSGAGWPVFLFNPGPTERVERRQLAMPDGGQGEVEVRVRVEGLQPGGLPQRLERVVITRLAGSERTSREVWTITPAAS